MKIAIIGTGIAGNVAAYRLRDQHDITVFEANGYVGGHTNTLSVTVDRRSYSIDTGFIVFNDWTYPNFVSLLEELGVESQPSSMSFSVQCDRKGLEYNGTSLDSLFAQRSNLFRPSFHRMIRDILRFNREAPDIFACDSDQTSLREFLFTHSYSKEFVDHYLVPMGAAIWSAEPAAILDMPARFFIRFFRNHGMLSIDNRPQWRVIKGGSGRYVEKLVAGHRQRIRLSCPVEWIKRRAHSVEIKSRCGGLEHFDQVFIACHSDQALRLLADASPLEREVLGAIPYQENEAVLHTDEALMPKRRKAWAAWNYHIPRDERKHVAVTYSMNILQRLDASRQFLVTLNNSDKIDPGKVMQRITYHHPFYSRESVIAQKRQAEINGVNRTYFCGAYWRNGFHEDGVCSALAALRHFEDREQHEELYLRRTG